MCAPSSAPEAERARSAETARRPPNCRQSSRPSAGSLRARSPATRWGRGWWQAARGRGGAVARVSQGARGAAGSRAGAGGAIVHVSHPDDAEPLGRETVMSAGIDSDICILARSFEPLDEPDARSRGSPIVEFPDVNSKRRRETLAFGVDRVAVGEERKE